MPTTNSDLATATADRIASSEFPPEEVSRVAVVLPGGVWQEPLVRFMRNRGYFVHIINPIVTDTVRLAHNHLQFDIRDVDKIASTLSALNPQPSLIITDMSDVAVHPASLLSQRLGLPGNPPECTAKFTDKLLMYDRAAALGIPVLRYANASRIEDAHSFAQLEGYPFVLKPADSTNTRGFSIVRAPSELQSAHALAATNSPTSRVVAQRFSPSTLQLTVEGICSRGVHKTLCISYKDHFLRPGFSRSIRWPFQSPLTPTICEYNDRFVTGSGLQHAITHAEYIIDGDNVWFNEIAARGGGYRISSDIVPWVTGIDVLDILHDSLLGTPPDLLTLKPKQRSAIIQFYRSDEINTSISADQILALPGVRDCRMDYKQNLYAKDSTNPRDCFVILFADDDSSLEQRLKAVEEVLC